MKVKASLTLDQEVLREIERLRGLANRSAFANHVLKLGLKAHKAIEKQKGAECLNPITLAQDNARGRR